MIQSALQLHVSIAFPRCCVPGKTMDTLSSWSELVNNPWLVYVAGLTSVIIACWWLYSTLWDEARSTRERKLWLLTCSLMALCCMNLASIGSKQLFSQPEEPAWLYDYRWRSMVCRHGQKLYWPSKGEVDSGILYCLEGSPNIPTTLSRYDRDRKTGDITKTIVIQHAPSE